MPESGGLRLNDITLQGVESDTLLEVLYILNNVVIGDSVHSPTRFTANREMSVLCGSMYCTQYASTGTLYCAHLVLVLQHFSPS